MLRLVLMAIALSTMGLACTDDESGQLNIASPPAGLGTASDSPAVTASPVNEPRPTWPTDTAGLYTVLPSPADLPPGWVLAKPPHSVQAPEYPPGPPNARVQYELEVEPQNLAEISCLEFYLVQLEGEGEAKDVFESFEQFFLSPSRIDGQVKETLSAPVIGDEVAASALVSTIYEIGACGTRSVFSYAGMTFRRGTVVAQVIGFSPKERPEPELLWEMARLQLGHMEAASFK